MTNDINDLITLPEAAAILGLTKLRVWQIVKDDRIKGIKRGRDIFVSRREVEAFAKIPRPRGKPKKQ